MLKLLIPLDYEGVLRLAPVTLPDFDGPILNLMGLLWLHHLLVQFSYGLSLGEIGILPEFLHLLHGWKDHESHEREAPRSAGVLIAHHRDVYELSHLLEVGMNVRF